jgi:hypothetical protein
MNKKKRSMEDRIRAYSDFYKRTFDDIDVEQIFEKGGQTSFSNFREVSKGRTKTRDYWDVMFNNPHTKGRNALGQEIFKRYIEKADVTLNKNERFIVRKGGKFEFDGKKYKGGMFVPKRYFARRTN